VCALLRKAGDGAIRQIGRVRRKAVTKGVTKEKPMSRSIPVEFRDLFSKRAYASLGTLRPDGSPQVTPVWCDFDGDRLLVNTAEGRHQDKNIQRDSRVAVVIADPNNPYRYLEIRGRAVEVRGREADTHLDQLARKYLGSETYAYKQPGEVRIMYAIEAERINAFSFPHAEWLSGSSLSG
jgi:PPOX class probable F420-dependent enzyme